MSSTANSFGQWEIVKVSKIEEPETTQPEISKASVSDSKHFKNEEHEEDKLGGLYTLSSDPKKRKLSDNIEESSKKVKTEDTGPRKPLSFSLSKKK